MNNRMAHLGETTATPIYAEDHLTRKRALLAAKARGIRYEGLIAHTWVRDTEVYIRQQPGDRAVRVQSLDWLEQYHSKLLEQAQRQTQTKWKMPAKHSTTVIPSSGSLPHVMNTSVTESLPVAEMDCDVVTGRAAGSVFPEAATARDPGSQV